MGILGNVKTIGDGKIWNIDPDPKPYGSDLCWTVVIDEPLVLERGTKISIYRNAVGMLFLSVTPKEK